MSQDQAGDRRIPLPEVAGAGGARGEDGDVPDAVSVGNDDDRVLLTVEQAGLLPAGEVVAVAVPLSPGQARELAQALLDAAGRAVAWTAHGAGTLPG